MSNDLISRKALLKYLADWWLSETPSGEIVVINGELQKTFINDIIEKFVQVVEGWPAAYDTDKVVKQLGKVSFVDIDEQYADDGQRMLFLHDAIEILKGGAE